MTPEQCRAARAWLDLSQDGLAAAAGVSNSTVRDYEAGRRRPIAATLAAMRKVLEERGVGFVGGETLGITGPRELAQEDGGPAGDRTPKRAGG